MLEATIEGKQTPTFAPLAAPKNLWGLSAKSLDELADHEAKVVFDLMLIGLSIQQVPFLWGPPGAGKTEMIRALSAMKDENGTPYQVIVLQPSTQDPSIIHGMFYTALDDGKTLMKRSTPDIVDRIIDYWNKENGLSILFLDEMTTCSPGQQAAMLGILTHGEFGSLSIRPYTTQVCAANPIGTVMSVLPLSEAIINRCYHLPVYGDVDVFLNGYESGFGNSGNAPSSQLLWYVENLLREGQADRSGTPPFRNGRWTPETLVPYRQIEHTPRSTTNWAATVDAINSIFASAKKEIRHHYLMEATKAYLGVDWANRFAKVLDKEETAISWQEIYSERLSHIEWYETTTDDFVKSVPELTLGRIGNIMPNEQISDLLDSAQKLIVDEVNNGIVTDKGKEAAVTIWAFVEYTDGPLKAQLYRYGPQLIKWGNLYDKTSKVPLFLARDSRDGALAALNKKMN